MGSRGRTSENILRNTGDTMTKDSKSEVEKYRIITKKELLRIVPYTPQHILRLETAGRFPKRLQIGPNRVGWLLSDIEAWIAARMAERDSAKPNGQAVPGAVVGGKAA